MDRYKQANKVSILGICGNAFLFVIKIVVGLLSRSQGLIADGLNSASDVFNSAMTFAGNKMAGKPRDADHPFGHGKAEYLFSMFMSMVMMVLSVGIFKSALRSIIDAQKMIFSWWIVVVCIVTIVIKMTLYVYSNRIGKEYDNILVTANALDHRNDVFLTLSTLIGVVASVFGVYWLDGVVGLGISVWIFISGLGLFLTSFRVLMDSDVDQTLKDEISEYVSSCIGVEHIDSIIAKPVGVNVLILLKISVDGDMTVTASHDLTAMIKHKLLEDKRVADVVVHVNPLKEGEKKMNLWIGEKYFTQDLGTVSRDIAPEKADKIIITCDSVEAVRAVEIARDAKKPLLAIMDGYNAVVKAFGGQLKDIDNKYGEQEWAVIDATSPIYLHLESVIQVCRGTDKAIVEDSIPPELDCMSRAESGDIIALRNWEAPKEYGNIYAINYDVTNENTPDRVQIVKNFLEL